MHAPSIKALGLLTSMRLFVDVRLTRFYVMYLLLLGHVSSDNGDCVVAS